MTRRPRLAFAALAALVVPACGSGTPTLPDVVRATIQVLVEPSPVAASQNPLTGSVSASYKVTINELAGLGGQIVFVSSAVFDPESGAQVALSYFDNRDMIVFVGSDRIEARGTVVVTQSVSYVLPDFRSEATLAVNVQVKDDRDNLLNQSVLLKIQIPQ